MDINTIKTNIVVSKQHCKNNLCVFTNMFDSVERHFVHISCQTKACISLIIRWRLSFPKQSMLDESSSLRMFWDDKLLSYDWINMVYSYDWRQATTKHFLVTINHLIVCMRVRVLIHCVCLVCVCACVWMWSVILLIPVYVNVYTGTNYLTVTLYFTSWKLLTPL